MIEPTQVWRRHHDVTHRRGLVGMTQRRGRGCRRATPHTQQKGLHVVTRRATTHLDDALHSVDGMLIQQLQHAHVVLDAAGWAVLFFQGFAEVVERCRQLPTTKDVGVIECRRPMLQRAKVMMRVEDLLVFAIRTRMDGNYLAAEHHGNAVNIRFHADGPERRHTRHAVAVVVEAHHLVLVGLGGLDDARIERMPNE